ncbi:MAG: hypothetical protein JNM93_09635 [Bacteriovoracaceae bacterium]|nr:hypothetical protein [Bacteriovoracaceae bacterium]
MKLILPIMLFLVSCNIEKTTLIFEQTKLSLSNVKVIHRTENKQLTTLSLDRDNPQSTGPTKFPLDPTRVEAWLDEISQVSTLDKPKKTFKIANLSPRTMQFSGENFTYDITGFVVSDEWVYLVIRSKINEQQTGRAAYLELSEYKKIFIDFDQLRIKKIPIPDYDRIEYVVDQKVVELSSSQQKKLVEMLKAVEITDYAHDGEVDVGILKNTKVGERINKNIKGYFVFIDDEKKTKVMFGRHHEAYFLARIWIEGHNEIWEAQFPQWPELNSLETELIK